MRADVVTECPDQTLLLDFLNERLTVQQLSSLDAHVSACPACLRRLEQLVSTRWGSGTISMLAIPTEKRPQRFGDYELLEEIAVGGMGSVWRVKDTAFDRELAVKVIRPELADRRDFHARFLREARLCARLTHPNIVPVHTQGVTDDGRPFYSMKLVAGETLAQHISGSAAAHRLPQLLLIFEQVCQAIAYAHRQGVLHRDLKPLNIMVGAHGEVQVMDWGLAKELRHGSFACEERGEEQGSKVRFESLIETTVGDIVGTLAYMPPEQARGEEHLTPAADVFALGAILCEILTGAPAYRGKHLKEVMHRAIHADLTDAQERLRDSGYDPHLIEITRGCLAVDPAHRPQDAATLAAQLAAYRAGNEQRLHEERLAAERQRGAAKQREQLLLVQAKWERRRRRLTSFLSLAVVLTVFLGGGLLFGWLERQHEQTTARQAADAGITKVRLAMHQDNLPLAEVELRRAQALLTGDDGYRQKDLSQLNDALELACRLEDVRTEYFTWSNAWFDCCTALDRYAFEFEESNWDVEGEPTDAQVQRIANSPVKQRLLAALDDWAWLAHREALRSEDAEQRIKHLALRDRLLRIARRADGHNATANRLRDGTKWDDTNSLYDLIDAIDPQENSPELLVLIGKLLPREDRRTFLVRCQHHHVNDFWLNAELGRALLHEAIAAIPQGATHQLPVECPPMMQAFLHASKLPPNVQEMAAQAISYYRAALVQQPDILGLQLDLATATALTGDTDGCVAICQAAIQRASANSQAHELAEVQLQLGLAQLQRGDTEQAIVALLAAVEVDEYYAVAAQQLVHVLITSGRPADARRLSGELGITALPDDEALQILAGSET